MKRAILAVTAVTLLVGLTGCTWPHGRALTGLMPGSCQGAPENCAACGNGCNGGCAAGAAEDPSCPNDPARCGCLFHRHAREAAAAAANTPGPPTGAVTYPYYTNRGPRDFLARNPQSIGP